MQLKCISFFVLVFSSYFWKFYIFTEFLCNIKAFDIYFDEDNNKDEIMILILCFYSFMFCDFGGAAFYPSGPSDEFYSRKMASG